MTRSVKTEQNGKGTADGCVTGQRPPTTLPAIIWSYVAYYDRKFPRGPLEPIVVGRCSDGLHERGREEPYEPPPDFFPGQYSDEYSQGVPQYDYGKVV